VLGQLAGCCKHDNTNFGFINNFNGEVGRDSSVGTATRHGLHGPEIESRWWRDFMHPSRTSLGPT
jgi:hypothetical protein